MNIDLSSIMINVFHVLVGLNVLSNRDKLDEFDASSSSSSTIVWSSACSAKDKPTVTNAPGMLKTLKVPSILDVQALQKATWMDPT